MRVQRWRRRGWTIVAAIVVAVAVAVPSALIASGVKNSWWTGLVVFVAAAMAVFGPALTARRQQLIAQRDAADLKVLDGCLISGRGDLPIVRQVADPRWLGVHPAARLNEEATAGRGATGTVPVYVPRDVDDRLRRRIARGGFVLLVGDSTAGKSRTAYEAITATVPDHVLVAPMDPAAVAAAIERAARAGNCVVWLNDVERYLGVEGLTAQRLVRLLSGPGHRVVVATVRAAELARICEPDADEVTRQAFRDAREVFALVDEEIRLERLFTAPERDRARDRVWDPRIADALADDEYGLAEYLAAGPELLRDWRNGWDVGAHPRGAALVSAAVDARRAGMRPPLPARLVEELAENYLRARGGDRLRPEPLSAAWDWVMQARRATTSLMTGSVTSGFDVFDYLVDSVQRDTTPDTFVPESTLRVLVGYADGPAAMVVGVLAYVLGHYTVAAQALTVAVRYNTDHLGPAHRDTLTSRNSLALVLSSCGRLDEAEREHRAVLGISTRVFGGEHRDTLTSRDNLATVLYALGRLDEAERGHWAVLDICTRVAGAEHPGTLLSRNNLASVLIDRGRLDDAEQELRAVLDIRTRVLGAEHPDTLTCRNNLANVLGKRGRLDDAEREHRAVLDIRMRVLGAEHPSTLLSRNNLASVLSRRGRLDDAEREHRAVLDISMRVLGAEHPSTLLSRNNLASVLSDRGRLEDAEREHRAVLDISMRVLGAEHSDTLASRNNLAQVLGDLGRLEESEREHRAVLDIRTRVAGAEHPDTLLSRHNLASVLVGRRLEEAEREHRAILDIRTRVLGAEHPDTLTSRSNLALVLSKRGRLEEAEREHRAILDIRTRVLGAEHPDTLTSRNGLGEVAGLLHPPANT